MSTHASTEMGMRTSMKPRRISDKKSKAYGFNIPKLGRFSWTRDPGEAELGFKSGLLQTHLMAIVRGPDYSERGVQRIGEIIEEIDLGSGLVTNIGVTALAYDWGWQTKVAEPINTFNVCKWHAWGTGTTAAAKTDFELEAYAKPTEANANAVEGVNSLKFENKGKNQKLVSTATITASSSVAVTEWGLHSYEKLKPTTVESESSTGSSLTGKTAAFTESKSEARGEQNKVVWAEKSEAVIGLIEKSTTTVVTIPGWIKAGKEETGTTPEAKSKFRIIPVLFDHRVFSVINVESGNKIEFPWELEIQAGG